MKAYQLLDSGLGRKLEAFGDVVMIRPSLQAVWRPRLAKSEWDKAQAVFTREGKNQWQCKRTLPPSWNIAIEDLSFIVSPTDFGHLGVFPEHNELWRWIRKTIGSHSEGKFQFMNLFAYSGGASLSAALAGAHVCHVDASKPMVDWARENAALNNLASAPIRWIVDDAMKFLQREKKRGTRYDGILLDPPSFGRGPKGEVFKIEEEILPLLQACREVLSEKPSFLILSSHTPGFTPLVMRNLLEDAMGKGRGEISFGEMLIPSATGFSLPSGSYAIWSYDGSR